MRNELKLKRLVAIAKKRWYVVVAALVLIGIVAFQYAKPSNRLDKVPLGTVESMAAKGELTDALILSDERKLVVTFKADKSKHEAAYPAEHDDDLIKLFQANNVTYDVQTKTWFKKAVEYVGRFWFVAVWIIIMVAMSRRKKAKSAKEVTTPPKERFDDVGANAEVIEALRRLIEGIQNPEKYRERGLKPVSGVLLYGPSGTGKTLLARAVAGEAGVPFFRTTGSDLIAEYSGQSQARVRSVFERAEKAAKLHGGAAIIFIDEIDAIGKKRSNRDDSTARDADSTLTQLLTCIDGFAESNVIVIAATNHRDVLDDALLRPGRLTQQILVPLPDLIGREHIFQICVAKYGHMQLSDQQLRQLAEASTGMSGSGISDLVDGAGREAYHAGGDGNVTWEHFREALLTVRFGPVRVLEGGDEIQRIATQRESRRAVVAMALPRIANPFLVSTQVRGLQQGATLVPDHPEGHPSSVEDILQRITLLVAGRAAEKSLFDGNHTSATNKDIEEATELAFTLVCDMDLNGEIVQWVNREQWVQHAQAGYIAKAVDAVLRDSEKRAAQIMADFDEEISQIEAALRKADGLLEVEYLSQFQLTERNTPSSKTIGFAPVA